MSTITIIVIIACVIALFISLYKDRYDKATFWATLIIISMLSALCDKLLTT